MTIQASMVRAIIVVSLAATMLAVENVQGQCEIMGLWALDAGSKDYFGNSSAIDGDRMIFGAHGDDDNGFHSGSVYIFKRIGDTWFQEAKLMAAEAGTTERFGFSVDICGEIAVIGAPYNNQTQGAAYIFKYVEGIDEWVQQQQLVAPDAWYNCDFGKSVAIFDGFVIVGAPKQPTNAIKIGAAYAYQFNDDNQLWDFHSKLVPSTGAEDDYFGDSVAIDGEFILVGAFGSDIYEASSGAAYVFNLQENEHGSFWSQQSMLVPSDGEYYDLFGKSVAISGEKLVVGAAQNNNEMGANAGSAFVFQYDANKEQWLEQAKLIASDGSDGDRFGTVAIENDVILVGSIKHDKPVENAGGGYVFQYNPVSKSWQETGKLIASDMNSGDSFGTQVDISNGIGLVSSPYHDRVGFNAGQVFVFNAFANEDNNGNGIIDDCEIGFADLNADGVVDNADLMILLGYWGSCSNPPLECIADLYTDGIVDTKDLLVLLSYWG